MPEPEIHVDGAESAIRFKDWSSLTSGLMRDTGDGGWIWRGQQVAAWGLESSLERAFRIGKVPGEKRSEREQQALSYFRAHAASYLEWQPADNDYIDWLVTMQHYGAPTRLLDWTESPFVAAYFAYRDMPHDETQSAALWLYDARIAMNSLQKTEAGDGLDFPKPRDVPAADCSPRDSWMDEINILVRQHVASKSSVPLPVVPLRPDARMTAQQTILTVDARLDGGMPYPFRTVAGLPVLFKIELPAEWRRGVLRELALMGITDAGLFPGVAGVAQHSARMVRDGFRHVRNEVEGH